MTTRARKVFCRTVKFSFLLIPFQLALTPLFRLAHKLHTSHTHSDTSSAPASTAHFRHTEDPLLNQHPRGTMIGRSFAMGSLLAAAPATAWPSGIRGPCLQMKNVVVSSSCDSGPRKTTQFAFTMEEVRARKTQCC